MLALQGAACAPVEGTDDGRVTVVASFFPLAEAAREIGEDSVAVTNLTAPGVEPHDLELSPDDLEAIAEADVVVMLGGGFQPAVEQAVEAEARGTVVDAMDLVEPIGDDPHVWLDPLRYRAIADGLAAAMTAAGADADGAAAFTSELSDLDAEFSDGLAACTSRLLVTTHEAFGYLADRYDLQQQAASGITPESEPDAARLAELEALIRDEGITTVFAEPGGTALAQTLADEAGIEVAELNPLEGLTQEQLDSGEDYPSVMLDNLDALREGLGCE